MANKSDAPVRGGSTGMVKSNGNKAIDCFVVAIAVIAILLCALPLLNVFATSLSSELSIINREVFFWPVDLDLEAYRSVFSDKTMIHSLILTAIVTICSTLFSLVMTVLCAYPLAMKKLIGRGFFNTVIIITMYFSAGIIPDYLNIKELGLYNSIMVLILPIGINVFYMIIMKSFFLSIPESLFESAQLDGASHWTILSKIYLPLSTSSIATLTLFYAVDRWNGFQDVRIYISDSSLYTIQFKLYQIISNLSSAEASLEGVAIDVAKESMKSASIVFATLPILVIYPFLQKYFVAGVTVGAVKG